MELPEPYRGYKRTLCNFLSFLDNYNYTLDHQFTEARLSELTSDNVVAFFKAKCYGDIPNPGWNDIPNLRKNTLLGYKRDISYFMINKHVQYDEIRRRGNPTRSYKIAEFLRMIGKKEKRDVGQRTQTRRAFQKRDYDRVIQKLKAVERNDIVCHYGIPAMLAFQFHMITRLDDATMFFTRNLQHHERFPTQALQARLIWSKNIGDGMDPPWQIVLGSMVSLYCVFINLSIWLELTVNRGIETTNGMIYSPYAFQFSRDFSVPNGGLLSKAKVNDILRPLFKDPFFGHGKVGTHSIRKFAGTHCRNNGCSKDDKDTRGRWKKTTRVSDVYEDASLPFADTKACISLCQGGACTYVPKPNCITWEFIRQFVTPNIYERCGREVAELLGYALMWSIFSIPEVVPVQLCEQVMVAYNNFDAKLPDGENPIERKELILLGNIDTYVLSAIDADVAGPIRNGGAMGGNTTYENHLITIITQNNALQRDNVALRHQLEEIKDTMSHHHRQAIQNHKNTTSALSQLQRQPHRMLQQVEVNRNAPLQPVEQQPVRLPGVSLSERPKTLEDLWVEWDVGIGGRKPAKNFTSVERGTVSDTFYRRKLFWDLCTNQINRGVTAAIACERIRQAYGVNLSVTKTINMIQRDKISGNVRQI